jgi:hypothetical protein
VDNRRFTYRELEVMTSNFKTVLGQGGFGCVYDGILPDGTQVAVKLLAGSSSQGVREFLTEVISHWTIISGHLSAENFGVWKNLNLFPILLFRLRPCQRYTTKIW